MSYVFTKKIYTLKVSYMKKKILIWRTIKTFQLPGALLNKLFVCLLVDFVLFTTMSSFLFFSLEDFHYLSLYFVQFFVFIIISWEISRHFQYINTILHNKNNKKLIN